MPVCQLLRALATDQGLSEVELCDHAESTSVGGSIFVIIDVLITPSMVFRLLLFVMLVVTFVVAF